MKKILIVDNDPDTGLVLKKFLHQHGLKTYTVSTGKDAEEFIKTVPMDLIICESQLPDYSGIEILQKIKIIDRRIPVLIIAGYSEVKVAVEAIQKGAFDYVTKPLHPDEILDSIKNAIDKRKGQDEDHEKKRSTSGSYFDPDKIIIGTSQQSQLVHKHIELIAPTNMSVIITGESGTGKEYIAREIHRRSERRHKPFIAVDCGALPKELAGSELFGHVKGSFTGAIKNKRGCFEIAHGGTLFLDEIGNLSFENQTKLLRVLQERRVKRLGSEDSKKVDIRLIVATNEDLKAAIQAGQFREDIYHRLNEFTIYLSPIRERTEDVKQYSFHFLELANRQLKKSVVGFEEEVMQVLQSYHWYGNLRELRNVIKRAVLLTKGEKIGMSSLPVEISIPEEDASVEVNLKGDLKSLKEALRESEKKIIQEVLKQTGNNKTKTAEILKIDRKTLYNKLKLHSIRY